MHAKGDKDLNSQQRDMTIKYLNIYVPAISVNGIDNLEACYDEITSKLDEHLDTLRQCLIKSRQKLKTTEAKSSSSQNASETNDGSNKSSSQDLPKSPDIVKM